MLVLPFAVVFVAQQIFLNKIPSNLLCKSLTLRLEKATFHSLARLVLAIYPTIAVAAIILRSASSLSRILKNWAQQIRDSEFLVEMRLRNLDRPEKKSADGGHLGLPETMNEDSTDPRVAESVESSLEAI